MSTPLHVILKADPRLEGDVVDAKAYPSVCVQLHQISVLQYILETAGSMAHQHVHRQAVFLEVLATGVALFWQTGKGGKWQVSWCLRSPRSFMMLGLCASLQYGCLTSSW